MEQSKDVCSREIELVLVLLSMNECRKELHIRSNPVESKAEIADLVEQKSWVFARGCSSSARLLELTKEENAWTQGS